MSAACRGHPAADSRLDHLVHRVNELRLPACRAVHGLDAVHRVQAVTDANADRVAGGDLLVHVRHDRPEPAGGVPAGQGGSRLHPAGTGAQDKHRADPATSTGSRPSYTGGSSTTAPGRRSDGDGARMFSPHPWPSKSAARQIGPICAWSSGNVARVTAEHNGGSVGVLPDPPSHSV